ncbi:MAG: glycoside hydrolase family 43 protein, partial [Reichenbachiella sp.]
MKSRVKEIAKISCMVILLLSALSFCTQKRSATFNDPILSGFYPDPSIVKVKEDFYMVNSTFSYFPGIPVFHSRDLVHWSQIGNAMDRPEQMNLEGCQVSEGIFAPAIRFSNGLYYITCTLVKNGTKNFIITAENPAGPWSDPIFFPSVQGIDPSLFFDANGKGYLIWNSEPPNGEPMYSGHRTIKLIEIDLDNMMVIGDEKIIVNGGTDISKKPVWIEGPHIFQENDFYYLIAAEGGTSIDHSEVVFRSTDVFGPYESYFDNPILTQRGLDPKRINPVSSTGHADFVKLDDGTWWGVFLGCRPYDQEDHYNTGRETFLAPVKWQDEWPSFDLGGKEV